MGKTHRRTKLDGNYGSFEGYYERSHHSNFALEILGRARVIELEQKAWNKRHRDGKSGYFHRDGRSDRAFYRKLSRKNTRNGTRIALHRGLAKADWDNIVFPDDHDGKKYIWSVW